MEIKYIKEYEGQYVRMRLKNNDFYHCKILEVGEKAVKIIDRFGDSIVIDADEIVFIRPSKEVGE